MEGEELLKLGKIQLLITTTDGQEFQVVEIYSLENEIVKGKKVKFISYLEESEFTINFEDISKVEEMDSYSPDKKLVWY